MIRSETVDRTFLDPYFEVIEPVEAPRSRFTRSILWQIDDGQAALIKKETRFSQQYTREAEEPEVIEDGLPDYNVATATPHRDGIVVCSAVWCAKPYHPEAATYSSSQDFFKYYHHIGFDSIQSMFEHYEKLRSGKNRTKSPGNKPGLAHNIYTSAGFLSLLDTVQDPVECAIGPEIGES